MRSRIRIGFGYSDTLESKLLLFYSWCQMTPPPLGRLDGNFPLLLQIFCLVHCHDFPNFFVAIHKTSKVSKAFKFDPGGIPKKMETLKSGVVPTQITEVSLQVSIWMFFCKHCFASTATRRCKGLTRLFKRTLHFGLILFVYGLVFQSFRDLLI